MKKSFVLVIMTMIVLSACTSPTPPPTATTTPIPFPQEWKGFIRPINSNAILMILYIDEVKGMSFTGRTSYPSYGDIYEAQGQYVQDFRDEAQLNNWRYIDDFKNGDKSGVWLKFIETKVLQNTTGSAVVNQPFYGHIREDGTMAGSIFGNDESKEPFAEFELTFVQ